jgi:alkylhydroperoxidase family enzyme
MARGAPAAPPFQEISMAYPLRVPPVDHANLDARQAHVSLKMGRFGSPDASGLMRTALNYPEFARSIGRLSTRVTLTTDLPQRLYQLACMRTAWLCDSEYLWASHRPECLELGLTDEDLIRLASGEQLKGDEQLIIDAVDQMHWSHYLSDETWTGFDQYGHNAPMDVMSTYAFYVTMAAFANSTGVELDGDLEGWSDALRQLKASQAKAPPRTDLRRTGPYPVRVKEADYARLSPAQREQTNRMGRRGLPTTSKLQKCMINYVDFMKALAPFGKRAIDDTCLPPRVWQLACMRTVWLCDSEYLWSQHRKAILQLGVTDEDLHGVAEGADSDRLQGFDKTIVRAVDDLYYGNRLSDDVWTAFDQYGREGMTDLILVYGLYILQSVLARSFGTTLEANTTGYLPELGPLRVNQQR